MKLHAYAQHSMHHKGAQKLQSRYFGPYQVLERVGPVAYKLELPPNALIHNTVHVSQLKLAYGTMSQFTPLLRHFMKFSSKVLEPVLERKIVKRGNRAATKMFIQWKGSTKEEVTWMFSDDFCNKYPDFDLEVNVSL